MLTKPKNSIIKQYQHLFRIDNVDLEFTEDALEAAAERALNHQTGARCLRYVIEDTLLDVMYDLPSIDQAVRCIVSREAIEGKSPPNLYGIKGGRSQSASASNEKIRLIQSINEPQFRTLASDIC
ncbi:MAG: hypothetical protein Ct9H300mP11_16540 [Chloroflexota bacterium]|nr:MAG: hypothetical protein Ct9H300mP11_16540 [Chloroflexota bacterium]